PVQGSVERPFFDEQVAVGDHVDPLGHGVPVARPPAQALENENVECSSEQSAVAIEHCVVPFCSEGNVGNGAWNGKSVAIGRGTCGSSGPLQDAKAATNQSKARDHRSMRIAELGNGAGAVAGLT